MNSKLEYTKDEILKIVINNFLTMCKDRNYIDNVEKTFNSISKDLDYNKSIKIKMNISNVYVYVTWDKMSSILNNSPHDEFINSHVDNKKFLIVNNMPKKILRQVSENSEKTNTQAFSVQEFMEAVTLKNIIPKHTILTLEEKEELIDNIDIKNIAKIFDIDRMSRYYNAKVNDIFRIERNNIMSGTSIFYRIVVPGKIDLLYD